MHTSVTDCKNSHRLLLLSIDKRDSFCREKSASLSLSSMILSATDLGKNTAESFIVKHPHHQLICCKKSPNLLEAFQAPQGKPFNHPNFQRMKNESKIDSNRTNRPLRRFLHKSKIESSRGRHDIICACHGQGCVCRRPYFPLQSQALYCSICETFLLFPQIFRMPSEYLDTFEIRNAALNRVHAESIRKYTIFGLCFALPNFQK